MTALESLRVSAARKPWRISLVISVSRNSIIRQRNPLRRRFRCRRMRSAALLVLTSLMSQFRSNYWDYFLPRDSRSDRIEARPKRPNSCFILVVAEDAQRAWGLLFRINPSYCPKGTTPAHPLIGTCETQFYARRERAHWRRAQHSLPCLELVCVA